MTKLRIIWALVWTVTMSTHAVAQANPAPRVPGTRFRDCRECPEMVVLPAGRFLMGSSDEEKSWAASHGGSKGAVADEAPQHEVSVPSFALGKYDVTRGQYAAFVRETGYSTGDGCGRGRAIFKWQKDPKTTWEKPGHAQTDQDPVVCVSWHDARAYVAWLNRKAHPERAASANGPYRLPSEAGSLTWQETCGNGPRTVTTTATPESPPTGAPTRRLRATPPQKTLKAPASEWIAAARGCFRPGCYDRPRANGIRPTTALTSWVSASLEHSRDAVRSLADDLLAGAASSMSRYRR
jgi:formylglycine-generating enzyme required for sulfatase activity